MIEGGASGARIGICRGMESGRVRGVGGGGLQNYRSESSLCDRRISEGNILEVHTCENWAFEQLDQLVNLDEHIHRHF